jgi:hypothetical protein
MLKRREILAIKDRSVQITARELCLPEEILLTEAFHRRFPGLLQIACFDTAFPRSVRMSASCSLAKVPIFERLKQLRFSVNRPESGLVRWPELWKD